MTCDEVRVALSARLDGEDPQAAPARLDAHVAECAGCRDWLARAEQVTRAVRVQPVQVPDLTEGVLAAVAADRTTRPAGRAAASPGAALPGAVPPVGAASRAGAVVREDQRAARWQILRVAVAVAAVAQLALALPVLLGGFGIADDPHTSREMASFDVALAVGFALAAYRPQRARAFVPVAFVLALCLAATSLIDVATASTALVHEVGHLAAVVQAALLWALGRATPPAEPPRRPAERPAAPLPA
jgi:predicted anti-sigma-YlaC factor YlaD